MKKLLVGDSAIRWVDIYPLITGINTKSHNRTGCVPFWRGKGLGKQAAVIPKLPIFPSYCEFGVFISDKKTVIFFMLWGRQKWLLSAG